MTAIQTVQTTGIESGEWRVMREQAHAALASGFLPKAIRTPEQALAVVMTGRELGMPPMAALRSIHIVEGKPTMSADLMAGLALSRLPGAVLRVVESTNERCVVEAARPGTESTTFTWTIEDANRAGLLGKGNWKGYPRAMLRARATSEACRATFPDVLAGVYLPEELEQPFSATPPRQQEARPIEDFGRDDEPQRVSELAAAMLDAEDIDALNAIGRSIGASAFSPERMRQLRATFREQKARLSSPANVDDEERSAIDAEGEAAQ